MLKNCLRRFPLTFLFHPSLETLLQSAVTTLVPFVFVHNTLPVEPKKRWSSLLIFVRKRHRYKH